MVIVYHRATFNIKLGIGGHVLDFGSGELTHLGNIELFLS